MARAAEKSGKTKKTKKKNLVKAKTKRANRSSAQELKWPRERNLLMRPERIQYVRGLVKTEGCVFCHAAHHGVSEESLVLHIGEHAMVLMNKFPYNNGHLLVLPLRHCGDLENLQEEEFREVHDLLRRSIQALRECYQPHGFNVGLNLGSAAGAGIPEHMHYHVIPRWRGDTNFFPLVAETKVIVETLEQTYRRLLTYFPASKAK